MPSSLQTFVGPGRFISYSSLSPCTSRRYFTSTSTSLECWELFLIFVWRLLFLWEVSWLITLESQGIWRHQTSGSCLIAGVSLRNILVYDTSLGGHWWPFFSLRPFIVRMGAKSNLIITHLQNLLVVVLRVSHSLCLSCFFGWCCYWESFLSSLSFHQDLGWKLSFFWL